ncbi:unnamed protein product [Symbiodinium sp. KB8]|nr:unnamed protein product [Symbiodinium sp. KB8]
MDGGSTSDAMRKAFDDLKEVCVSMLQHQTEQRAQLQTLQRESELQEEKISKLQKELAELKQLVARKNTAATQAQPVVETKVYSNGGIIFSREHLMSCLDAPSGSCCSFDIRMLPCLDELARDLGRPEPSKQKQSSKSSQTNKSAGSQQTWCKWHGQWWYWAGGWNKWVPK